MWQGPHGQNESAQRQRSELALTALHTTGKGILAKMLTFVFDKSVFDMKEYLLKSIVTALVFIGITIAFDAIFNEIDIIWKYLINGVLFGFVYEGWWHFYQKGVFSKEKLSAFFKKKDSIK